MLMHNDISRIHSYKNFFKTFELFTLNEVVKIAAIGTSQLKLDRKIFHSAFKKVYKK